MNPRSAIGVDLGGTELKVALVDSAGAVMAARRWPTGRDVEPEAVVDRMVAMATPYLGETGLVEVIGLCSPGPLDSATGVILAPPSFPAWRDVPLAGLLGERLGRPVVLDNDAHAAAIGEWRFGAARGLFNFVYITVSTGIGGGIVVDGRLLRGRNGLAGHVGHMIIDERAGAKWETLASGSALAQFAEAALAEGRPSILNDRALSGPVTARAVGEAALEGDSVALSLIAEQARYLGIGVVNLAHLFAPDRIIVGGGVSALFELLRPSIDQALAARLLPGFGPIELVRAELGGDAGVIGAAALAFDAVTLRESVP